MKHETVEEFKRRGGKAETLPEEVKPWRSGKTHYRKSYGISKSGLFNGPSGRLPTSPGGIEKRHRWEMYNKHLKRKAELEAMEKTTGKI